MIAQISSVLQNGMFVFWCAVTIMAVVPSLAYYWAQVKAAELEAGLKQTMLDRGMSADEIERVLGSKSKKA